MHEFSIPFRGVAHKVSPTILTDFNVVGVDVKLSPRAWSHFLDPPLHWRENNIPHELEPLVNIGICDDAPIVQRKRESA